MPAISVGSTALSFSNGTYTTSWSTVGTFTPNAGGNKEVIVIAFGHGIAPYTASSITAWFGTNTMESIAISNRTDDPGNNLQAFRWKVGSSESPGLLSVHRPINNTRWLVHAFNIINVQSQVPVFETPTGQFANYQSSLGITLVNSGLLIDVFGNNTDDTATSNNTIYVDSQQTAILNTVRGAGLSTEGRLASTYKYVSSGANYGQFVNSFVDGQARLLIGFIEAQGVFSVVGSGGVYPSGTSPSQETRNIPASGGAYPSGTAPSQEIRQIVSSGGAYPSGTAPSQETRNIVSNGGIFALGTSASQETRNIPASGSVYLGGSATVTSHIQNGQVDRAPGIAITPGIYYAEDRKQTKRSIRGSGGIGLYGEAIVQFIKAPEEDFEDEFLFMAALAA